MPKVILFSYFLRIFDKLCKNGSLEVSKKSVSLDKVCSDCATSVMGVICCLRPVRCQARFTGSSNRTCFYTNVKTNVNYARMSVNYSRCPLIVTFCHFSKKKRLKKLRNPEMWFFDKQDVTIRG